MLSILLLVAGTTQSFAAMSVSLSPSIASPAPVGRIVTWNTTVSNAASGTLWYRFRVRSVNADFQTVRDYGPLSSLDWTASDHEGSYEIEVSVRNQDTGDSAVASVVYQMISRIIGNQPVISPTANPLVFLYSAPPCPAGSDMRVHFQPASSPSNIVSTPYKPCGQQLSMNFYLAGMPAGANYFVRHEIKTGFSSEYGPIQTLTIPAASLPVPTYTVTQPPLVPLTDGVLLHSPLATHMVATDLNGNPVWYYPGVVSFLTRPKTGGFFLGIIEDPASDPAQQILREFDLVGNTIRETNAARINEQLAALGKRQITAFHHDAEGLPNDRVLVLASTERILNNVQGSGPVDIIGDMILVLDPNLQVFWTWDAFDHLDPRRSATLGEVCIGAGAGCPPFHLAPQANDWLHGNSLHFTPDGNILYSSRHQDWLIKIDYKNGTGIGGILWRLGKDGDFLVNSNNPSPWFSHQHDGRFELGDDTILTVFDNGNVRRANDPTIHSRGQIYRLDESNHIAELIFSGDLGGYSLALGSAQKLHNGNYHFNNGFLPDNTGHSVETDFTGRIVYSIQSNIPEYRSFRMTDLYTPYESNVQPEPRLTPTQTRARLGATTATGGK
jgi:arylsulfate sulfotransferase